MFLLGINAFESLIIFAVVSELHCCMTCSFNFYFSKLTLYTECCIELSESCTWLQALRKILSDYEKKQVSGSIGSGLAKCLTIPSYYFGNCIANHCCLILLLSMKCFCH